MFVLIPILLAAVWMDIKTGKIKNQLILVGYLTAFLIQLISRQAAGILIFFSGAIVPLILLMILYVIGVFGAGDVKLFSVVGGFLGPILILRCIEAAIFSAALYSILLLIKNRNLITTVHHFLEQIQVVCLSKGTVRYQADSANIIHFSIFIFIGVIFCLGVKI